MKIIAVRHTSVNVAAGLCYGQTDVETACTYPEERNMIITKLAEEPFQAVYSSPSLRCRKLAEDITNKIPITYDSRLLELNFGLWEGKLWDEISQTSEAKAWFDDWINLSCPEGESYQQLINRVKEFIEQIKYLHRYDNILTITHSGVIRALHSLLTDTAPKNTFGLNIKFGSIATFKMHF
jgi:alpha-ribazole phosphatase